jgi:hypothetical protein
MERLFDGYTNFHKLAIPFCDEAELGLVVHAGSMKKDQSSLSLQKFS